jgi:RNA polymerase sigma-70 factor (ECF subfamily)
MPNPATLTELFAAHAGPLVLYARQRLDRSLAEEVVQEAFVRLMSQRMEPRNAKAWLYRTVRNEAISQHRSRTRREQRERVAAPKESWFEPDDGGEIDGAAAREAVQTLPSEQREAIVLRIWGQLTLKEIAAVSGSSTSTVFDQYRAGLRALRKKLEVPCKTNEA